LYIRAFAAHLSKNNNYFFLIFKIAGLIDSGAYLRPIIIAILIQLKSQFLQKKLKEMPIKIV